MVGEVSSNPSCKFAVYLHQMLEATLALPVMGKQLPMLLLNCIYKVSMGFGPILSAVDVHDV